MGKKAAAASRANGAKGGRPKGAKTAYDPDKHCGAKTSDKTNDGSPCTHVKGYGTAHVGVGRCRFHGGATPIKHGRYSQLAQHEHMKRFHELLRIFTEEPDPLNLVPDLIALRARAAVLQEEEARDRQMLADWHESYTGKFREEMRALQKAINAGDAKQLGEALERLRQIMREMPPKPVKLWDPFAFVKAVQAVATLVGKINEQRAARQIPLKAVVDLQDKMALVMMTRIRQHFGAATKKGDKLAEEIAEDWRSINVEY